MPHKINVGLAALAVLAAAALADPSVDRRASMGFMGMRGKKDDRGGVDEASAAVELNKRTLAFRRPLFDGGSAEGFKRAMGFVGMRGKKEYHTGPASAAGFFGMRGKKVPSADAFFGMRGKKRPEPVVPLQRRDRDAVEDADVERAVRVLHRIIDDVRMGREQNFVVDKFDEGRDMR